MSRPTSEALNRSGFGGLSETDRRPFDGKDMPVEKGRTGPVPPSNQSGHKPEQDQDKPVEAFVQRAEEKAAESPSERADQ